MKFRSNRLLIKLVLSYLVTGALLTVLLMVVVSGFISGMITRQANQSARELLGNAYSTTYFALTDAYGDFTPCGRKTR